MHFEGAMNSEREAKAMFQRNLGCGFGWGNGATVIPRLSTADLPLTRMALTQEGFGTI